MSSVMSVRKILKAAENGKNWFVVEANLQYAFTLNLNVFIQRADVLVFSLTYLRS